MKKETYEKAKEIMNEIERLNRIIERVEKTDDIYYKTPDMDGGFTREFITVLTRKPKTT